MRLLQVQISDTLLIRTFTMGWQSGGTLEIVAGLPEGCELVGAQVVRDPLAGRRLDLMFADPATNGGPEHLAVQVRVRR